ncbi:MAG: homocysteine S-methyltransferase family protein [Pseudomonadota bacterium]
MNRYQRMMNRIGDGAQILIDGATGTEIEKRGVPQLDGAWNGGGALSHPDVLRQVHEDYLNAGAEIIIANTFATHLPALREAGVAQDFDALNRVGVELAAAARDRVAAPDALVAGGMSYWSWAGNWSGAEDLRDCAREQAAIMADAGADLLMLEMMVDVDRMLVTLEAAQASGLPVWVGLSCEPDDTGGMRLLRGGPLADALTALEERDVRLISIMHTEVEDVDPCLDVVQHHWAGPVGVYAHSARWSGQTGIFDQTIPPEDYASHAERWLDRGIDVVGGCCGLGTSHINALHQMMKARAA